MNAIKLIVTSKKNLSFKYGSKTSAIDKLLQKMQKADKAHNLDTRIVYIDDAASCKAVGVSAIDNTSEANCKAAIDALYQKLNPAYIVIVGAGDVIPFQEIDNPAEDEDLNVPSDLPYACESAFSRSIDAFTGPTRVVGRIPDLPGKQKNTAYLTTLIGNAIAHKPAKVDVYRKYFAVSAQVWKKSTEMSLQALFNDSKSMINSPKATENTPALYTKAQLKATTHFYNCHGSSIDPCYYGQRRNNYPEALRSKNLVGNITPGTVVAAECCFGAQLYDYTQLEPAEKSVVHTYLEQGAVSFVGSTTIAYGPADSNALADLMTQYFIKNILKGASAGRAFLEARQQFLTDSGPQLDPYELKTLAQFYLLGDPSVVPALSEDSKAAKSMMMNSISNSRGALASKGNGLLNTMQPSQKEKSVTKSKHQTELADILNATNFGGAQQEFLYEVAPPPTASGLQKSLGGGAASFRAFIKKGKTTDAFDVSVLVIKENKTQVLGYRVYERR
jgi:hypothetical protein